MMGRQLMLYGPRPPGKVVRKLVTLPDGKVIEHDVFVADPPKDNFTANKAQPGSVNEFFMVPKRGSGTS